MKKVLFYISLLLVISSLLFSSTDYNLEKKLTVKTDQTYPNNIISLGGEIEINGKLEGSIILIGGHLKLLGEVQKDVICIAADVDIQKTGLVKGELMVIGGKLSRHTESKVMGELLYFRFDLKKIENTLMPILSDARTIPFIKAVRIIIWFIITLVVFALIPQKITLAEKIFSRNILKVGLAGLLAIFSFIFLLFVAIVLFFIIIGVPLLLLLIVAYLTVFIFGRTVIFYFLGVAISKAFKIRNVAPAVFILIGVILYAVINFLPVLGPFLSILLNILEIGIGVAFFLRKKIAFQS
jgi:hypothetical protein